MGKNLELEELEKIKKLLVLQLLKSGVTANSLATLLNMDPGEFSRKFPVKKLLG
jgi:hypothetical protein